MADSANLKDLAEALMSRSQLSRREADSVLRELPGIIEERLAAGVDVRWHGFGTFLMKERAARTGRNPKTGETLQIPASRRPGFRPAKGFGS